MWEAMGVALHVAETMLDRKQSHYLDYNYLDEQRGAYKNWCGALTNTRNSD